MYRYHQKKSGLILISCVVLGMMALLLTARQSAATEETIGGEHFVLGNEAYVKGDYDQAVLEYKKALNSEGYTPSVLYNLGNAYYMKDEIGAAILNYERALYLDPANPDIKGNLALARKKAGLGSPHEPSWKAWLSRLTLNGWTWLAVIGFGVLSLMILLKGMAPRLFGRAVFGTVVFLSLFLFLGAGAGVMVQYDNVCRGIITAKNTQLRISPFESAEPSGVVNGGRVVNLGDIYEGYVFVTTDHGKSGWIPKSAVTAVVPSYGNHQVQTALTPSHDSENRTNGVGT